MLAASVLPPATVLDLLSRHKAEVIALLRPAWLHSRCWPAWYATRKVEAVTALAAMGFAQFAKLSDDFGKAAARDGRRRIGMAELLRTPKL